MPTEIIWKILKEAAISTSIADTDVDFQKVLTSLAGVCRRFCRIVRDPAFYKKFLEELVATDAAQCCRRKAYAVELLLPGINVWFVWSPYAVLGDELFIVEHAQPHTTREIHVFDLKPLDDKDRARSSRTRPISLVHLRKISKPTASIDILQSCDINNSIYVTPWLYSDGQVPRDIFRISPEDGRILASWTLADGLQARHMSVCQSSGHVCVPDKINGRIVEFDADGRQTRLIDVSGLVPSITPSPSSRDQSSYRFDVTQTADSTFLVSFMFDGSNHFDVKQAVVRVRPQTVDGKRTMVTRVTANTEPFDKARPECYIYHSDASRCIYTMVFDVGKYGWSGEGSKYQLNMISADLTLRRRIDLFPRRHFELYFRHQLFFESRKCRLYALDRGRLLCYGLLRDEFE